MKVIFLDIDGVLNSWDFHKTGSGAAYRAFAIHDPRWAAAQMDPKAIRHLEAICRETGAAVVISSTWRIAHPIPLVALAMRSHGFTGNVIGCTVGAINAADGQWSVAPRAESILAWVDAVRPEAWIAIDDATLSELGDRWIRTEPEHGLQQEHVRRAIRALGRRVLLVRSS